MLFCIVYSRPIGTQLAHKLSLFYMCAFVKPPLLFATHSLLSQQFARVALHLNAAVSAPLSKTAFLRLRELFAEPRGTVCEPK